jgi:hypothetical protein
MDIKQILDKVRHQEEKRRQFFALQIEIGLVKSAIWAIEGDQVKVLAIGSSENWQDGEDLIKSVDTTLSSAVEKLSLGEDIAEPDEIIFGLPPDWVDGEKVKTERIEILREISQKLDLKPVGFVVTVEAIIHHLKNLEGVPPTAILVGLRQDQLVITVTNLGKTIGTQLVEKSDDLGADLLEGLSRFKEERFPARILLYNGPVGRRNGAGDEEELEEARQELVSYSWQDRTVHFLHLPKVEILSSDFDIKAVTLAGGYEIGQAREISGFSSELKEEGKKEEGKKEGQEPAEVFVEEESLQEETENFGFVQEKDIAPPPAAKPSSENHPRVSFLSSFDWSRLKLPKIDFSFLSHLGSGLKTSRRMPGIFLLVGLAVLILGGLLLGLYWYLPRAEIVLSVNPQKLEKEFTFSLDPSLSEEDEENLALPAEEMETVIEGAKTRQTTGTKLVGDPAKGEVVIFNRTSSRKVLSAGTELIGPNDLVFALDDEVSMASESAGPDYTRVPGKATARVTAVEIGTEGNLASGTEFDVADYAGSDLVARNESAFSGGTSREIQAVSEEDQEKLLAELKEELEGKALDELSPQVLPGKKLLDQSLLVETSQESFNQDIGDESDQLELRLKLKAMALVYDEEKLLKLIEERIKGLIPPGFKYRREESEINYHLDEMEEEKAIILARFSAQLIPEIDLEKISQNLAGKNLYLGKAHLENLPHVEAVEIRLFPRLPGRLAAFPRIAKRIEIQLKVD